MPESKKHYAQYLLNGVLFGIGFVAVAIFGAHYIVYLLEKPLTAVVENAPISQSSRQTSRQTWDPGFKKDLTIVSYVALKEKNRASNFEVLGNIKNSGDSTWADIEIQAEFFNKGQFVDECVGHIRILPPKENENFELICGECGFDDLPEFDKTDLKVTAAFRPN